MGSCVAEISWLGIDSLGYPPFQHSVAATFYPHLLKKEKGRFTGFKPNVKLEFGVGQLAFVRAKVNSWIMFLPYIESETKE